MDTTERDEEARQGLADNHNTDSAPSLRALLRFMDARGLKAGPLAARAGFRPSAIYNLTAGRSREPSITLLEKIAAAEGVTVADIMAYGVDPSTIDAAQVVVAGGRIMASHTHQVVTVPTTVDPGLPLKAAIVSGDALFPVPAGWVVYYAAAPTPPAEIGRDLAVVQSDSGADLLIGTLSESREKGRWDLQPWHGPAIRGLSLIAAHRVFGMHPPIAVIPRDEER